MNLDMKEEMENLREESLMKSEHLFKLEKRNDSLQQEVRSESDLFVIAGILQGSECWTYIEAGRVWSLAWLKHFAAQLRS